MLTTDDRFEIGDVLALHADLFDGDLLDRLPELFTPDAVYDMTRTGMGAFEGIETIRIAAARLSASGHGPLAHFVTNIVLTSTGEDTASARSRGLMVMADGAVQAVTHDDELRRLDGSWRIARRVITPLRARTTEQSLADAGVR